KLSDDLDAAKELAEVDSEFAKEAERLESEVSAAHQKMLSVLAPRDPEDASDVLMEIKAGAGGEESALFAGDLLRMYQRYSEKRGWSFKVMDMNET
ncbi:PCRF domain-containing protein, partial [Aerococcus urinae]